MFANVLLARLQSLTNWTSSTTAIWLYSWPVHYRCHPSSPSSVRDTSGILPTSEVERRLYRHKAAFDSMDRAALWKALRGVKKSRFSTNITWTITRHITDLLQPVTATSSRSSLRDASRGDYVIVPRTNRKTADRAFSTAAPRAWNQLPTELKRTQSTSAFRRGLKTFLFFSFQPCIVL